MSSFRGSSLAPLALLLLLLPAQRADAQTTDDLRSGVSQGNVTGANGVTLFSVPAGRRFVLTDFHFYFGSGGSQFGDGTNVTLYEGMTPRWASRIYRLSTGVTTGPIEAHLRSGIVFAAGSTVTLVQDNNGGDAYDYFASWSGYLSSPTLAGVDPGEELAAPLGLSIVPNPAGGASVFSFELPRDDKVSLGIYDVAGRLVRTIFEGPLPRSTYTMPWNGTTDAGARVEPGQYFVRLKTAAGRIESAKITKLD